MPPGGDCHGQNQRPEIPGLERKPKREGGYFDDLPYEQRRCAEAYLRKWIERRNRRGKRVARWLRPILVGQAKRLARNPPTSAWGRSMQAKKGGYAVQQLYRMEGRDPTAKAEYVRKVKQGKPAKLRPIYPAQQPIHTHLSRELEAIEAARESRSHIQWPSETDWKPTSSNTTDLFKPMSGEDFERFLGLRR